MRSPDWKPLGAALAAASVALAVTACATGERSSAARAQTSSSHASSSADAAARAVSATGETPRQRAEKDAAAILTSFAVPPGGHRLAGPPSLPGGVLKTPASFLVSNWEVHLTAFWEAPGSPQAVLAWERAHLPRRFALGDAGFGPPAWDRGFELAPEGALVSRELDVEVASTGGGQTGIRVDAWVAWQPPRPASSLIPPTARTVAIADLYNDSATPNRPPVTVTITDPGAVRKLAALIDGLPLSTTPPEASCPSSRPSLSLTFRARPGGPALAIAQTGQQCYSVALTVRGARQLPLQNEPTLDTQILKVAGLSWKIPAY
jgi:hypothetical protein